MLLLSGCVQNLVRSPQFEMREAGLLRFNPPGLNGIAPEAVIRVTLDARNPNPFDLNLEELRVELLLDGAKIASSSISRDTKRNCHDQTRFGDFCWRHRLG